MANRILWLVHAGDQSKWVWPYYSRHFVRYWPDPEHEAMDCIWLSEEEPWDCLGMFESKLTGRVPWGTGLIRFLRKDTHRYIVYNHEDYFLRQPVDVACLKNVAKVMGNYRLDVVHWLGEVGEKRTRRYAVKQTLIGRSKGLDLRWWNWDNWLMNNHQPAMWRREYLLSTIKSGYWGPWQHEDHGREIRDTIGAIRWKDRPKIMGLYSPTPIDYIEAVESGRGVYSARRRPKAERYWK